MSSGRGSYQPKKEEAQPLLSSAGLSREYSVSSSSNDDDSSTLVPTRVATPTSRSYGGTDNAADGQAAVPAAAGRDGPKDSGETRHRQHKEFREIWALFLGLAFAVFCSALGGTIVANLTIEIGSYFHAGSLASWLGTAFLLGLTAMTPLYGRLAQVLGRKGVMLLALAFYLIGTIMCAVAPSMGFMLAARVVAGAGSGGMLTVTAIIISDLVSLADRGLYQGGVNLLFGAGSALGAVLGGSIADNFGWRAAFWMQVPPVVFASLMVFWKVNVEREEGEDVGGSTAWEKFKGIDWLGSFLLMVAISAFSTSSSLCTSSHYPLFHPLPLSLLAIALIAFPLFIFVESKAAHPILPLTMLKRPQPSLILFGFVLTTATNFSRLYMQPVYLHVTRGLNGSETGLILIPASIVGSVSSLYAGWHMKYWKEYKWFQAIMSLIPWLQALSIMTGWQPDTSPTRLAGEMAVGALGGGATITTLMTSLIACVEPAELSLAISACYLFRAIGQVIGVSIAASIQQSVLMSSLSNRLSSDGKPDADLISKIIQEPAEIFPYLSDAVKWQARLAYLDSIRGVFGFVVAGGMLLSVVCLGVRGRKL
ncbi:hypothetical protein I316_02702 [Kwoniella heveanensis BCC8398]|uniref:Major facilitator superfamily (MFS) profile domain-containing protein n=1 Tax=Kwoniella heveanensis BCC8398 TaxID=1296120 RepID=A0A1B9GX86_9TREE|nr:hypothetical protein I316_02702 [Kwoniella heveanensis BCC8398]